MSHHLSMTCLTTSLVSQVKVSAQLGEPRHYLVLVGGAGGNRRLPAGPARLHLHERRFALTAGVPPRLLGIWELPHLRSKTVIMLTDHFNHLMIND